MIIVVLKQFCIFDKEERCYGAENGSSPYLKYKRLKLRHVLFLQVKTGVLVSWNITF